MTDSGFILENESGRLAGFRNLLGRENARWWGSGKWLVHLAIWFGLLDLLVIFSLYVLPLLYNSALPPLTTDESVRQAINMYLAVCRLYLPAAIIILVHDAIIRERELGTMAWIMSKPASRTAFVLSKMASGAAAILIFMVIAPGLVACAVLSLYTGGLIDPLPFFSGLAVLALQCMFYLSLTFLTGTMTSSRYAVIGVGVLFLFAGLIGAGALPALALFLTWNLPDIARDIALGLPLPSDWMFQLGVAAAWIAIMASLSVRQIERIEI